MNRGSGRAPGTCGELVQGALGDGTLFQVSLPVDAWAQIDVEIRPAGWTEVEGLPQGLWKSDAALRLALHHFTGTSAHVRVRRVNPLPVGQGFGSSSADVVAAIKAVAAAFGRRLTAGHASLLAARIEPTDGVASERPVVISRHGHVLRTWSWTPQFTVVAVAGDGAVETCTANVSGFRADAFAYVHLLEVLDQAVVERNAAQFAAVATDSARLHLARRHGHHVVHEVLEASTTTPALGVVIAHTGTCAGLLLPCHLVSRDVERAVQVLAAATGLVPTVLRSL